MIGYESGREMDESGGPPAGCDRLLEGAVVDGGCRSLIVRAVVRLEGLAPRPAMAR
jgi:hypothetical protein